MFLPDFIDLAQSEKYSLSIRLAPNGFSFLIFLTSDKSVYYYNKREYSNSLSVSENIKKIFFESSLFTHPFNSIIVSIVSPRYTMIPESFFDKEMVVDLFNFNFHGEHGKVMHNSIDSDIEIVFDMEKEIYSFLHRSLWNPKFTSLMSQLIPFCKSYGEIKRKRFFIFLEEDISTIICFDGDTLLSANSFIDLEEDDITYNIVNIWDKHQFDQNEDLLYISSTTDNNINLTSTLKQLINNVETIKLPENNMDVQIPTDILIQLCE